MLELILRLDNKATDHAYVNYFKYNRKNLFISYISADSTKYLKRKILITNNNKTIRTKFENITKLFRIFAIGMYM